MKGMMTMLKLGITQVRFCEGCEDDVPMVLIEGEWPTPDILRWACDESNNGEPEWWQHMADAYIRCYACQNLLNADVRHYGTHDDMCAECWH